MRHRGVDLLQQLAGAVTFCAETNALRAAPKSAVVDAVALAVLIGAAAGGLEKDCAR